MSNGANDHTWSFCVLATCEHKNSNKFFCKVEFECPTISWYPHHWTWIHRMTKFHSYITFIICTRSISKIFLFKYITEVQYYSKCFNSTGCILKCTMLLPKIRSNFSVFIVFYLQRKRLLSPAVLKLQSIWLLVRDEWYSTRNPKSHYAKYMCPLSLFSSGNSMTFWNTLLQILS